MIIEEKTIKSERVFDGKIIKVDVDDVELVDGKKSKREIVHHVGGVGLLFVIDGKIAMTEQYRYAFRKPVMEIPAGKMEDGEDPKECALRELEEETGYVASDARLYLTVYPSPGFTDEVLYVYLIDHAIEKRQKLDPGEFLDCFFVDLSEVERRIDSGEINDAKTICAVYKYIHDFV